MISFVGSLVFLLLKSLKNFKLGVGCGVDASMLVGQRILFALLCCLTVSLACPGAGWDGAILQNSSFSRIAC